MRGVLSRKSNIHYHAIRAATLSKGAGNGQPNGWALAPEGIAAQRRRLVRSRAPQVSLLRPGIAPSPRPDAAFSLHQVIQNIVDAGQAPYAFATQPIDHPWIEPKASPRHTRLPKITLRRRTMETIVENEPLLISDP